MRRWYRCLTSQLTSQLASQLTSHLTSQLTPGEAVGLGVGRLAAGGGGAAGGRGEPAADTGAVQVREMAMVIMTMADSWLTHGLNHG
jgi:hypothetical protein